MGRILVADDQDAIRRWLARELVRGGHEVEEASNGNAAIERLHASAFDLVLTDLKMAGSAPRRAAPRGRYVDDGVIVMTERGSVRRPSDRSRRCVRLLKPFRIDEIGEDREASKPGGSVTIAIARAQDEIATDRHRLSPALQRARRRQKVMTSNTAVLILGETGSGFGSSSRTIHHNSRRKSRKMKVNCAALHENLLDRAVRTRTQGVHRRRQTCMAASSWPTAAALSRQIDMAPARGESPQWSQEHAFGGSGARAR